MAEATERNPSGTLADSMQIVVFRLGQEEYGMTIHQIKEVVITPTVTHMPQTPDYVKGVANIRGNIIAILDLEKKFALAESQPAASGNNFTLVVDSDEYKMGVLVKEVPNTLRISKSSIEDTVFTGEGQAEQAYVTGIVKLDKRLIIMIDIFKVVSEQDARQLFKKQTVVS